jgi:hypothetical protein
MLPSISSLRRGSARGKTSASLETSSSGAAPGNWPQDRLASDHDQILGVGDYAGGSDDVLQLCARHEFAMANWS